MTLIKNPEILRNKVLAIETKIINIVSKRHRGGYQWHDCPDQRDKIKSLLYDRASYLDNMFLATPEEVARFEQLNSQLIRAADEMRDRCALLYKTLLSMPKADTFDEIYGVEGILRVEGDSEYREGVLKLSEDEYYGSDFLFVSGILCEMIPDCLSQAYCGYWLEREHLGTDKENPDDSFTRSMEDGNTWAEGALCHPALSHICICHPIHDICTHHPYSIPDLLRINSFKTSITLTIEHHESQPSDIPGCNYKS